MQRRTDKKQNDDAVSPVVGVMLMLVVTIIIAAVVSMYATGLYSTQEKTPTAVIDTSIKTTAGVVNSLEMDVLSVSDAIPTGNLKLTIAWSKKNETGQAKSGSTTFVKETNSTLYNMKKYHIPLGFGAGISGGVGTSDSSYKPGQYFGNYTLVSGTSMANFGSSAMKVLFGEDYTELKAGDVVSIDLVHIPTGNNVYSTKVTVI